MLGDSWRVGIDILEGFGIKLCKTKGEKQKKNIKRAIQDKVVILEWLFYLLVYELESF